MGPAPTGNGETPKNHRSRSCPSQFFHSLEVGQKGEMGTVSLIRRIIGSTAPSSTGVLLAALIPVPVVPPSSGTTARLRRAGRGPRNGQSPPTRPRFAVRPLACTSPPGAIRAACGIPSGYHNRCRVPRIPPYFQLHQMPETTLGVYQLRMRMYGYRV